MEDIAKKYLRAAYKYGAKYSIDPTTQNGAVLVNEAGEIVAKGANHSPRGVRENEDRWEKPRKYFYVGHAEKYAIFEAARKGIKTEGLTMYCPWSACAECARAIIQTGIKKVVAHKQAMDKTSPHWKESVEAGLEMLREAEVEYEMFDGKIGKVEILLHSKPFYP